METYSRRCLYFAIFTIIVALGLTVCKLYTIKPKPSEFGPINLSRFWYDLYNIQQIITINRPGYLFIALTLFLSTLYSISFSFGFHDKYFRTNTKRCSIIRTNIDPPNGDLSNIKRLESRPASRAKTNENDINIKQTIPEQEAGPKSSIMHHSQKITCLNADLIELPINFIKARADVLYNKTIFLILFKKLLINKHVPKDFNPNNNTNLFNQYDITMDHIKLLVSKFGQADIENYYNGVEGIKKEIKTIELINSYSLAYTLSTIKEYESRHHFVISLAGYTTSFDINSSKYPSNYDLSEARAIRVREAITRLMTNHEVLTNTKCPSIDWIIFPMTSDCPDSNSKEKCLKTVIKISKTVKSQSEKLKEAMCKTVKDGQSRMFQQYMDIQKNTINMFRYNHLLGNNALQEKLNEAQVTITQIVTATQILKEQYISLSNEFNILTDQYNTLQNQIEIISLFINKYNSSPLKLLDYLHYTIYTITTTGYGDMSPADDFAKFLTSLTNVFEILFGLIFFNVILSRDDS